MRAAWITQLPSLYWNERSVARTKAIINSNCRRCSDFVFLSPHQLIVVFQKAKWESCKHHHAPLVHLKHFGFSSLRSELIFIHIIFFHFVLNLIFIAQYKNNEFLMTISIKNKMKLNSKRQKKKCFYCCKFDGFAKTK